MDQAMRLAVDDLRVQIRSWDPALDEDSDEFDAALVMLAALYLGSGHGAARKLADFTGVAYERTLDFQRWLRTAGIWQEGRTVANWDDEKTGVVAFWCDVNVALGHFELKERRPA